MIQIKLSREPMVGYDDVMYQVKVQKGSETEPGVKWWRFAVFVGANPFSTRGYWRTPGLGHNLRIGRRKINSRCLTVLAHSSYSELMSL